MIHHVHPAPVAFLATSVQRETADIGLEFLAAVRALLESARFLPGLGDDLLGDEVKFVRQPLDEPGPSRTAGVAAFNFPDGILGKLITHPAIHTNAPPGS